ncbi:hypothetical protein ACPZ19_25450 [Amycolatopsis lurida]
MRKLFALLTAAAATLVLGATPATAGTVTVDYHCAVGGGIVAWDVQYRTTITAPASVAQGQTATVKIEYTGVKNWTTHSPAGTYNGWGSFKLGGAATGTVTAPGLTNPEIQPGEKMRFVGASAQVSFPAKGQVTYTPATFNYGPNCIVWTPAGVAATTSVV